ncbi:MAG: TlpA disulfide reductase family protein [Chloroflexota bacterium]
MQYIAFARGEAFDSPPSGRGWRREKSHKLVLSFDFNFHLIYGCLIIFLLVGCTSPETTNNTASGEVSSDKVIDGATNFTLTRLDGGELSLVDLRGQYVLVNFWATWCIPCRKEMPYLQDISEKHQDQLVILGINMGEDADRVQPFIDEMGLTFPILLDPPSELTQEHNVRGLPVSFVVGPEGDIVYRRVGEILPEDFDVWLADNL